MLLKKGARAVLCPIVGTDYCDDGISAKEANARLRDDFPKGFELDATRIEAREDFRRSGKTPSIWVVQQLMDAGLLTVAAGPKVLRWLAPMNTTEAEVRAGLKIMREVLQKLS